MKKRTLTKILTYSIAAFVVACGFAVKYKNETDAYRRAEIYGGYMAMTSLADAAESISRSFMSAVYAYSPQMIVSLSNNIWKASTGAVEALSHLPVYDSQIDQTRIFISRAGDYAAYLSRTAAEGDLSVQDRQMMKKMADAASDLSDSIRTLESDVYAGNVIFSGMYFEDQGAVGRFEDIENASSYPSLVYNGMMSESNLSKNPAMLVNAGLCDKDTAQQIAAKMLNCSEEDLQYDGESGGRINCHIFRSGENEVYISCRGGYPVSLRRYDISQSAASSEDDAVIYDYTNLEKMAVNALEDIGFDGIEAAEVVMAADYIEGKFVCSENGVCCYEDTIYAGYSPNAGFTSLDASGYILNHNIRNVSEEIAQKNQSIDVLPPGLDMQYVGSAVISNSYGGEDFCRVYTARTNDDHEVTIYCGAADGLQKRIEVN